MNKYSLSVYTYAMLKRNSAVFAYIVGSKKNPNHTNQPNNNNNKKSPQLLHGSTQIIYLRLQDLNTVLLNCVAETKQNKTKQNKTQTKQNLGKIIIRTPCGSGVLLVQYTDK